MNRVGKTRRERVADAVPDDADTILFAFFQYLLQPCRIAREADAEKVDFSIVLRSVLREDVRPNLLEKAIFAPG